MTANGHVNVFEFVDSLPKNPSGKLLKRGLRQRFAGGDTLDSAIQKMFDT